MTRSATSNYIYNLLNTITGTLFPLITFPYATRIMLADGIGLVNFYNSIISYIILVVGMGIPLYGVREVARVRDDSYSTSKVACEILSLHGIFTIIGYVVIFLLSYYVPEIRAHADLFLILSASVFFTTIGCNWFFQGIEDFKYITIRAIIVRLACMVFLFVFVKTRDDILLYGIYSVLGSVGNNVFNLIRFRKHISIDRSVLSRFSPWHHLRKVSLVFIFTAISTIYLSLNSVFLGFMKGAAAVGYYTAGLKIYTVVFGVIGTLTTTLVPRFSNLISSQKNPERLKELAQKAYRFVLCFTFPMCVGLIIISPYVVILFCGNSFQPSIIVSQIAAPMLVVVGLSNLLGMQFLYSMGHIRILIMAALISSVVDIFVLLITAELSQTGAVLSLLCAECSALAFELVRGKKYFPIKFRDSSILYYSLASIVMGGIMLLVKWLNLSSLQTIILMFMLGFVSYVGTLLALRESLCCEIVNRGYAKACKYVKKDI